MKRAVWRRAAIGTLFVGSTLAGAVSGYFSALGPPPLGVEIERSRLVVDRDGRLLRPYTTREGRWRLPAERGDADPRYLEVLLAYEDRRFFSHWGVDPLALGRATLQFAANGRIVSGASTITMQVARLLEPRSERSMQSKLRQMARAIQIERALSKDEILSLYLTLAPYGGNLEGIRAAALAYYGKEPRRLTLAEAALLVALPQAPELRRPDRSPENAEAARDRVLERMAGEGLVERSEVARAAEETVPRGRLPMPLLAAHASDDAVRAAPEAEMNRLTIDARLQKRLEALVRERARALGPDIAAALVTVDHATGEVLARVGSPAFFDARRAGQVDLTRALRSPGSALKPFIYGLGFEDGLAHPETLIEDQPVRYGNYAPENFDQTFQGTVTVRRALQLSLNVPAVALLEDVGPSRLSMRLFQAGAPLGLPKNEAPGLALGLGGVGVRLLDLTMLYAALARGGEVVPLIEHADSARRAGRRLLESVAAWYVAQALRGTPPPEACAGGRIAFKTGTSYGYRDAWAVGFDGAHTIGVWVGRPDGAPVVGLSGRNAAAPLLFDAFARLGTGLKPLPPAPDGAIVASTATLPPPLKRFRPSRLAGVTEAVPLRITFPPHGASLALAANQDGALDPIAVKIAGGRAPLTLMLNGVPVEARSGNTQYFAPDGPGFVRLTVMDANGAADSVTVRLQ
jgi:penicillin-binding protein 1C